MRNRKRRSLIERCEARRLLTTTTSMIHELAEFENDLSNAVVVADIDVDGDLDIFTVAGRSSVIQWYLNDGKSNFTPKTLAGRGGSHADESVVTDFDGDSDLDVITIDEEEIVLYRTENDRFVKSTIVTLTRDDRRDFDQLFLEDLDSDQDLDIIVAQRNEITWYEKQQDGYADRQTIATPEGFRSLSGVWFDDLDVDGDIDIIYSKSREVAWIENINHAESFELPKPIPGIDRVSDVATFVDIDNDGDNDWFIANGIWFEKGDEKLSFSKHQFPSIPGISPTSMSLIDVESDGDLDLFMFDHGIIFQENLNGKGSFGPRVEIALAQREFSRSVLDVGDLNGDGTLDFVVLKHGGGRDPMILEWHERRLIGDVDRDGSFDSDDLIQVFNKSEYDDGVDNNSTFDEGDWNGDGDFDSADLVLAFEQGHFQDSQVLSRAERRDLDAAILSQQDDKQPPAIRQVFAQLNDRAEEDQGEALL